MPFNASGAAIAAEPLSHPPNLSPAPTSTDCDFNVGVGTVVNYCELEHLAMNAYGWWAPTIIPCAGMEWCHHGAHCILHGSLTIGDLLGAREHFLGFSRRLRCTGRPLVEPSFKDRPQTHQCHKHSSGTRRFLTVTKDGNLKSAGWPCSMHQQTSGAHWAR